MDTNTNEVKPEGGVSPMDSTLAANNSKRSLKYLLCVVVVGLVIYYSGAWNWLENQFELSQNNETAPEMVKSEGLGVTGGTATINGEKVKVDVKDVVNGKIEPASATVTGTPTAMTYPKGKLLVTVNLGAGLDKLVVRQFEVYNEAKDSWILLYDGYKEFSSKDALPGGKMLTDVSLAALNYSKARAKVFDGAEKEVDLSGVTVKVGGTSAVVTFSADGKGELKAS